MGFSMYTFNFHIILVVFCRLVTSDPEVIEITSTSRIAAGQNYLAELKCKVKAEPSVTITWKHKDRRIPFNARQSYSNGSAVSTVLLNWNLVESINPICSTPNDITQVTNCSSEITCCAFYGTVLTERSETKKMIYFNARVSLRPVSATFTEVQNTSAVLQWYPEVDNVARVLVKSYDIVYYPLDNSSQLTRTKLSAGERLASVRFDNLNPGTRYIVQLRALSVVGKGPWIFKLLTTHELKNPTNNNNTEGSKNKPVFETCPSGWYSYQGSTSCYRVVNKPTAKWSDARRSCSLMGGYLAIVNSEKENSFLGNLGNSSSSRPYMWIGLIKRCGHFRWVDNSSLISTYSNWEKGEPNNANGDENCGFLYLGKSHYTWNDHICDFKVEPPIYACEMQRKTTLSAGERLASVRFNNLNPGSRHIVQPRALSVAGKGPCISKVLTTHGGCPSGWDTYQDSSSCYRIVTTRTANWFDAYHACQSMGGYLVKIDSEEENRYVSNLASEGSSLNLMWIGLSRISKDDFIWTDGTNLSGRYSNWNNGEPNNAKGNENCAHLFVCGNNAGYWNDHTCNYDEKPIYACEKKRIK